MNVCPICLFVNAADAEACSRCGKFRFHKGAATIVAEPPPALKDPATPTKHEGSSSSTITKPDGVVSVLHSSRDVATDEGTGHVAFGLPPKSSCLYSPSNGSTTTSRLILKPRLEVVRGEKLGVAFLILEGKNLVGRTVATPVDIDLTGQEPVVREWSSRMHACLTFDGKTVILEDLNSLNGTFVNRQRVLPGQQRIVQPNDVIQVGTVQLRVHITTNSLDG